MHGSRYHPHVDQLQSLPELVISPCSYMESLHVNEQAVRDTTARRFILDTDIG